MLHDRKSFDLLVKKYQSPIRGFFLRQTLGEQRYCMERGAQGNESFAARFAGKEAVLKALGTGLRGGTLQEIEILPDELGCPQVRLSGQLDRTAAAKGVRRIWISLSHTARYATAQCVMEGDG